MRLRISRKIFEETRTVDLPQDFSHQFPLICSLSYVVQFFFSFRNAILETLIVFKSSTVNEIKPWAVTLGYVHSIHHNRHDQTIDRSIDWSLVTHSPIACKSKKFRFHQTQKKLIQNWNGCYYCCIWFVYQLLNKLIRAIALHNENRWIWITSVF